jgi:hypothetical protein
MPRLDSCPRRSRPSPAPTNTNGGPASPTTRSIPDGPRRPRITGNGPSSCFDGSSTASHVTAAMRSRPGTGRSGTSRTSATGAAPHRSSINSTIMPSTRRPLPTARVGGPDVAGSGGRFAREFYEHCLRGTNYATGAIGTPLDFVSSHAKGAPVYTNGQVRLDHAHRQLHRAAPDRGDREDPPKLWTVGGEPGACPAGGADPGYGLRLRARGPVERWRRA